MPKTKNQIKLIICDIIILFSSFFFTSYLKTGAPEKISGVYYYIFFLIFVIWLTVSYIAKKYQYFKRLRYTTILSRILKSDFIVLALLSIIIFAFRFFLFSRFIVFGTIFSALVLEIVISFSYYYIKQFHKIPPLPTKGQNRIDQVHKDKLQEIRHSFANCNHDGSAKYDPGFISANDRQNHVLTRLRERYLVDGSSLFKFLDKRVRLDRISEKASRILYTRSILNIKDIENHSLELFMNLYRINDFPDITEFISRVNKKLKPGGIFICCANTIKQRHNQIKKEYPYFLSGLVYFFDFFLHRVFPKFKITKKLYFRLTKGGNRPLSMTEVLGRLLYCGFQLMDTIEIDNKFYYLCQKEKDPPSGEPPSYGLIFSMRRRGQNGEPINIYKFRTMHTYAEYLHEHLADMHGYRSDGKLLADYRKTRWGRFLRKTWLDELPQLINIMKGDMAIVGVRAFSDEYLKNYPQEHIKERQKYKPGAIPTYVALNMDNGHEARIKSEKIYLKMKQKHPLLTDIKFFFMAVYNILFRQVKSA